MTPRICLFVYGTLRAGAANHRQLAGAIARGGARTLPRYELVDLGAYPALVSPGSVSIVGELYLVDAPLLAALDRFEGADYARLPVALASHANAEAYLLRGETRSHSHHPRIASGDWFAR